MPTLSETIAKAITPDASDTERERVNKQLVQKQLQAGTVTAEGLAANLALEAHARTIAKRDGVSFETGFVKAIYANPELAALLD